MFKRSKSLRAFLRLRPWLLAITLVAASGVFDLRMLRRQTLWVDEIFSLAIATGHSVEHPSAKADSRLGDFKQAERPVPLENYRAYLEHEHPRAHPGRVIRAVFLSDTNPPLFYLLLSVWTRIVGTTDGALRSFSVGWFLACLPLLLVIARRVGGPRAELGTGLLFGFSPMAVYYSTEGRMYSLLWFWILSTALLSLLARDHKRNLAIDTLWVVSAAAGLLTHYFFVFPLCAMLAFLVLRPGADSFGRLLVRLGFVIVLVTPWYQHVPTSLRNWRVTQDWLNWLPHDFSRPKAIAGLVLQFFSNDGHYLWWDRPVAKIVLLAAFGFLFVVLAFKLRMTAFSREKLLPWLWFAAGCAGPVAFDSLRHTYTVDVPRYALSALPAAALLGGLALACLPRLARLSVLAVILGAWAFSLQSIYQNPSRDDQPFWKIGQILSANAKESDLIIVHSIPTGVLGVARYVQSPARMVDWVQQLGDRTVPESISEMLPGFRRVFFLRFHEVGAPAPEEDWLRAHAKIERDTHYGLMRLVEFSPLTGERF